jgi:hypothetical protein
MIPWRVLKPWRVFKTKCLLESPRFNMTMDENDDLAGEEVSKLRAAHHKVESKETALSLRR